MAGKRATTNTTDHELEAWRQHRAEALPADIPEALRSLALHDRVTVRRSGAPDPAGKAVVYWMQRSQRATENPALDVAIHAANVLGLPVVVYFAGISNFPHANLRHYVFLNEGLRDVATDLEKRNCTFVLRNTPHEDHLQLFHDVHAAMVIGDENPMHVPESWRAKLARSLRIPFWTVDGDVIVPTACFDKAQYAARTIRPRLWRMLPTYTVASTNPRAKHAWQKPKGFFEDNVHHDMTAHWQDLDRTVPAAPNLRGGSHAAHARLKLFVRRILPNYDTTRNQPERDGTSMLSPYLHYGHICPITIYLAVEEAAKADKSLREAADSFLDELITWRELCINFVKFNPHYDKPQCADPWAEKTIAEHELDKRDVTYTLAQLEKAQTHDELWNAAQRQGIREGWMHNYLRMYWAKKVLEWSPTNAIAQKHLIHLNDKYFLDGRDPGGYGGIAWAIYGKFDRAWGERNIFGKLRYMSGASTGKKFDSAQYIQQNPPLK